MATTLTSHTVEVGGGLVAGMLVRNSGRVLGYIWKAGATFRWSTADASAFGERSTLKSAVDVLEDVAKVRDGQPLSAQPTPRIVETAPTPRPTREVETAPAAPAAPLFPENPLPTTRIVWAEQSGDVTAALADAWRKAGGR